MTQETDQGEHSPEQRMAEEPSAASEPSLTGSADAPAADAAEGRTEGGYAYTVVDDDDGAVPGGDASGKAGSGGFSGTKLVLVVLAAAIIPAIIVGGLVWYFTSSSESGGSERLNADVTNVLNAFSSGRTGTVSTRYEGQLAPGYPSDLPTYPGAHLVSSVAQVSGSDVGYLAIYDTTDARNKVSAYFADKLSADPWQVEAGQDGADSALHQFSKIDDPNITGLVLAAESQDDNVTTIVVSSQVASGAANAKQRSYEPAVGKTLPADFPEKVTPYPDATLIETAFQKQSGGQAFNVSFITHDDTSKVLDYYRQQLASNGLTVTDGDASQSSLEDATALEFTDGSDLNGLITAGKFAEDDSYTRIDVQAQAASGN